MSLTGFPGGSDGKVSACNVGDLGSIPGSGRCPWIRKWQPTPVFLSGKFHGQRSLAGYSPWGCKQSDTTEQLSTHRHQPWVERERKSPLRILNKKIDFTTHEESEFIAHS